MKRQRKAQRKRYSEDEDETETPAATITKRGKQYSTSVAAIASAVRAGIQTPQWRLKLADDIENGRVSVQYPTCDLTNLRNLKPIPKNSASLTGMILAEHFAGPQDPPRDVIFKASFGITSHHLPKDTYKRKTGYEYDNSLPIEQINYQYVANALIRKHWTPHVASYIASFQCHPQNFQFAPQNEKLKILYDTMYTDDGRCTSVKCAVDNESDNLIYDTETVNVLITERMNGQKLEDWIKTQHSLAEWKSVLYQILYTLECFNRIGFRHNDLHLGNLFIENIPNAPTYTLYVTNVDSTDQLTYTKVPTKGHEVRIYDFDRSTLSCERNSINPAYFSDIIIPYMKALLNKTDVDNCVNTRMRFHCSREGACQDKNTKFDAFTVLGLLWASSPSNYAKVEDFYKEGGLFNDGEIPPQVLHFIEKHLHLSTAPYNPLELRWNWPYRMVKVNKQGIVSSGNYELPDSVMSTVMVMLTDTSFFNFKRGDLSTLGTDCLNSNIYHLPIQPTTDPLNDIYSDLTCDSDSPK